MNFSKKHILIIDNEVHLRSTIELLLKSEGYNVSSAENGMIAIEKILGVTENNTSIDLIILDIQMPLMNGLDLIDLLEQGEIYIPILVITGYLNKNLIRKLQKRHCTEYLDKPFDCDALMLKVDALLK